MTSIKGVLFLKNVDGKMEWVNGDSVTLDYLLRVSDSKI